MSDLIAVADGPLTDAGTWALVDSTSFLHAENANAALTTSNVESQTFAPGAITIDGIAVKVASRAASPSGTMTVRLAQGGALVAGTEVTINVSDLPARDIGWVFFKFAAPVLLVAATNYTVSARTSVATQVNLYRNSTAGNWARMLRTTTTQAPVAGDNMYILGEWTAAGTKTDRAVEMDSTANTDYGSGSTTLAGFVISKGGSLTWGTDPATNYILRLSTLFDVYLGGEHFMGTGATPCPRDSTMQLQFDCGADGDFGLRTYGGLTARGQSRTSGKNVVQCLLNTDEAAAQTTLGVDTDTGWLSGDEIAIASTSRTFNQAEVRSLNADAGASSLAVSVGLTNAHSGTSPTQAEVILLTRNVSILSVSSSFMAYCYFGDQATIDCEWTAFRYLGATTAGKRGLEVATTTGSVRLAYCVAREFDGHGLFTTGSGWNNLTLEHFCGYKIGSQASSQYGVLLARTTGTNVSLTDVTLIGNNTNTAGGGLSIEIPAVIQRLRVASHADGVSIQLGTASLASSDLNAEWSDWVIHSNGREGIAVVEIGAGKLTEIRVWRNGLSSGAGLSLTQTPLLVIEDALIFGNGGASTGNIRWTTTAGTKELILRDAIVAGDSTFTSPRGFQCQANSSPVRLRLENCEIGVAAGDYVSHSTADVEIGTGGSFSKQFQMTLVNSILGSATPFVGLDTTVCCAGSFVAYQHKDQVAGDNMVVYPRLGTVSYDASEFRTAAPSEKLEPNGAGVIFRLQTARKRVAVASGSTIAISCYVKKSVSYTGSAPRLVLLANAALGVDTDTVIDTAAAAAGIYEQLSGATPAAAADGVFEFVVEVDGSAGQVNVDDWSAA